VCVVRAAILCRQFDAWVLHEADTESSDDTQCGEACEQSPDISGSRHQDSENDDDMTAGALSERTLSTSHSRSGDFERSLRSAAAADTLTDSDSDFSDDSSPVKKQTKSIKKSTWRKPSQSQSISKPVATKPPTTSKSPSQDNGSMKMSYKKDKATRPAAEIALHEGEFGCLCSWLSGMVDLMSFYFDDGVC
jgi:hypothetical protein